MKGENAHYNGYSCYSKNDPGTFTCSMFCILKTAPIMLRNGSNSIIVAKMIPNLLCVSHISWLDKLLTMRSIHIINLPDYYGLIQGRRNSLRSRSMNDNSNITPYK